MKTFFERFLDEVERKQESEEIDHDKAQRWIAEIQTQLQEYAEEHPSAPIVKMPVQH